MPAHDDLGIRMKEFYEKPARTKLTRRTPVAIRIDGKAFHTFTHGFQKPFDKVLMRSMQETMKYLCKNIQGCVFGYTQSDEITLILIDYQKFTSSAWFDYEVQKLCSISASMATIAFNKFFEKNVEIYIQNCATDYETQGLCGEGTVEYDLCRIYQKAIETDAMFDARCFNVPKEEVANLIYWRQLDATRNSIQMVGHANFSQKELHGKSCNMIQDMLLVQKDINWNDFPTDCKRGAACTKEQIYDLMDTMTQIEGKVTITKWMIDREMPILKGVERDYVERFIYIGEGM